MNSYDLVPYASYPFPETHPGHLETIAYLFGLQPEDYRKARVLEIGCSSGGNVIPLAYRHPESFVVGLDLSKRQIEIGQRYLQELSLKNLQLIAGDVSELGRSFSIDQVNGDRGGAFDYIIVHGVYSWVNEAVQGEILRAIKQFLAPNGVAYLSYNALPGWHSRMPLREMLRLHAASISDSSDRLRESRRAIRFFLHALEGREENLAQHMREMLQSAWGLPDWFLYHDLLEENNTPFYLFDVVQDARRYGLSYLGDAELSPMVDHDFPSGVQTQLRKITDGDIVLFEQYLDFFRNRMLKRSLLVHEDQDIDRSLALERILTTHIALPCTSVFPERDSNSLDRHLAQSAAASAATQAALFTSRGVLETEDPLLQKVFQNLASVWPATVPCLELIERSLAQLEPSVPEASTKIPLAPEQNIAINLFRAYMQGFLRLRTSPIIAPNVCSKKPAVAELERYQARLLGRVTTLWHEHIELNETEQTLLSLLDGSRDHEALAKDANLPTIDRVSVQRCLNGLIRRGFHVF